MNEVYFTLILLGVGFAGGYVVRNHVQGLLDGALTKIGLGTPVAPVVPKPTAPVAGAPPATVSTPIVPSVTSGLSATEVAAIGNAVANALKVQLAPPNRPQVAAPPPTSPPAAAA